MILHKLTHINCLQLYVRACVCVCARVCVCVRVCLCACVLCTCVAAHVRVYVPLVHFVVAGGQVFCASRCAAEHG